MFEVFILRRKIAKENKKKSIRFALIEHSHCANCKYCKVKTEKIRAQGIEAMYIVNLIKTL